MKRNYTIPALLILAVLALLAVFLWLPEATTEIKPGELDQGALNLNDSEPLEGNSNASIDASSRQSGRMLPDTQSALDQTLADRRNPTSEPATV